MDSAGVVGRPVVVGDVSAWGVVELDPGSGVWVRLLSSRVLSLDGANRELEAARREGLAAMVVRLSPGDGVDWKEEFIRVHGGASQALAALMHDGDVEFAKQLLGAVTAGKGVGDV